ncbi:uncharacterized protein LOC143869985 [Tasmannia lanceolata]|uniref:uncharacterized protein LOC143869985 n=1 Tax=Tasmannia lanceolata TaxID=3420 RepID=UPI0040648887
MTSAVSYARLQEEKLNEDSRRLYRGSTSRPPDGPLDGPVKSTGCNLPVKRLTEEELKDRTSKGLCWHCDEKWHRGHRCRQKRLLMIEPVDDTDIEDDGESDHEDADQEGNCDTVAISVDALAGYSTPQTMRVNGYIKRQSVMILIDSGSTNNFLDIRVAKRLSCPVEHSDKFEGKVADGRTLTSTGKCSNMKISVQDQELVTDLFLLPQDGCDLVLGAQWLRTLGDITWNFSKLIMQFSLNGKRVIIKGKGGGSVTTISNHRMEKLVQKEHEVFLVQLRRLESFETATEAEEMEVLLLEFAELFEEPKGLPPKRSHDHRIPVLPGSSPANVRPYRYPYIQKVEIEKVVREMLALGIIRSSVSPYSSHDY